MDAHLAERLAAALGLAVVNEPKGALRLLGERGEHHVELFLASADPRGSEVVIDPKGAIPPSLRVVRGDGRRAVRGTLDELVDRHLWVSGDVADLAAVFGPATRRALAAWLVTPAFEVWGGVLRCGFEWSFGQSDDDVARVVERVDTLQAIARVLSLPAIDREARLVENALADPLRPARHRSAEVLAELRGEGAGGWAEGSVEPGARWARTVLATGTADEHLLADALEHLRRHFPASLPDQDWLREAAGVAGPRFAVALGRALGTSLDGTTTDAGLAELLAHHGRVDVALALIEALEAEGTARALGALGEAAGRLFGDRRVKAAAQRALEVIEARTPVEARGRLSLSEDDGALSLPLREPGALALRPEPGDPRAVRRGTAERSEP